MPSPPTEAPVTMATSPPRDVRTNGDIEIGIGNASPAKMRDLQRTLSGSHDDYPTINNVEKLAGPIPTAPVLQELIISEPQIPASSDDGAYDIGRLATKSDSDETDAPSSGPVSAVSPPAKMTELPSITIAPQSRLEEYQPEEKEEAEYITANPSPSPSNGGDNTAMEGGLKESILPSRESIQNGSASSDGTLTATTSLATVATSKSQEEVDSTSEAQRRAKEAISLARNKSQRVKKPPVGRPMTVAEMEASDDEYEPGWASVISTFSNRT